MFIENQKSKMAMVHTFIFHDNHESVFLLVRDKLIFFVSLIQQPSNFHLLAS